MKIILGAGLILMCPLCLAAQPLGHQQAARIADAIYIAEGGAKAKAPYGILSPKVRDQAQARRICLNTIQHNHARWVQAGKKGRFIDFLADRYCPPSDSVGNKNWKRNVRLLLKAKTTSTSRLLCSTR